MSSAPQLPDLNRLPSVLEVAEVSSVLRQTADALDRNPEIPPQAAIDCMVDAMFAQAYRPDEQIDPTVCGRILQWIRQQWPRGDAQFAQAAVTVLANLTCAGVDDYVKELLHNETRLAVVADLKQCAEERRPTAEPGASPNGGPATPPPIPTVSGGRHR